MVLWLWLTTLLSLAPTEVSALSAVIDNNHPETKVAHADEEQWLFEHCPDAAVVVNGDERNVQVIIDPPLHIVRSTGSDKDGVRSTGSDKDGKDEKNDAAIYTKTWIPGYPGSGSEMLITIIEGLTGLDGANAYHSECQSNTAISCKTHYPVLPKRTDGSWRDMENDTVPVNGRYFILLRNPAHSIPSYFNFRWETKQDKSDHTTQAPIKEWRKWRDKHFAREVKNWANIIRTWQDESPLELSLYLPFERLVNPAEGPVLVQHMASEFALANSIPLSDDPALLDVDMVPCLWKELVMDHPSKRRSSSYVPGYTTEQKEIMLRALEDLMDWAVDFPADASGITLNDILDGYYAAIKSELVIDD